MELCGFPNPAMVASREKREKEERRMRRGLGLGASGPCGEGCLQK